MRKGDTQLATPYVEYTDTKTNIEAMTGIGEGAIAYASDTDELGTYNGSAWTWRGATHTQNTDTGTTSNTFTIDSDSTTGKIILDVALGASNNSLTLTNTALTADRTITFKDATGIVPLLETVNDFTANQSVSANLAVGATTTSSAAIQFEVHKDSGIAYFSGSVNSNISDDHATFYFLRGRGTKASPSAVGSGDELGRLRFAGQTSSVVGAFTTTAYINGVVESAPAGSIIPTYLTFATVGASVSPAERMRITSGGSVGINCTPLAKSHVRLDTATTNAIQEVQRTEAIVTSTGVAAAGFGAAHTFYGESATNASYRQMGQVATYWRTATDATRAAVLALSAYDTAERKGIEIEASGTVPFITLFGSLTVPYVAKTADYTLTAGDYTVNVTANNVTITLPTAVGISGRIYQINNSGTGTLTIATTSSQTVNGAASGTITLGQYEALTVQSNGSNYIVL